MRLRFIATAPAVLSVLGTASAASAHAFLDHAVPAVGSTVAAAPAAVTLSFTENIEPAFSHIAVANSAGQPVDLGNTAVPPGKPAELTVGLKPLPPGAYTVNWRVVSVDTHPTEGSFTFQVGGR